MESTNEIEKIIGYVFNNKELLVRAFTHSSYTNGNKNYENYERLEFIGDAVLGYVMGMYLYEIFPNLPVGALSKIRSNVVDRKTIASVVDELDLIKFVRTDSENTKKNINQSSKIKCDIFEALIGAIVIDNNNDVNNAAEFILKNLKKRVSFKSFDYKSQLIEYCAKKGLSIQYKLTKQIIQNKKNIFTVVLVIEGEELVSGEGSTIKEAEQEVSKFYMEKFLKDTNKLLDRG